MSVKKELTSSTTEGAHIRVRRWSEEALKRIVHKGLSHKIMTDVAINGIWAQ